MTPNRSSNPERGPPRLRVHAHLVPLVELVDECVHYAVALVDKEKARLFTVFLGEIEESEAFKDLVEAG